MASRFHQGKFIPKNPHKYVGDVDKIRFMSSWEYEMDTFLDNNPNILLWSSEEIAIKYIKPTDQRIHTYYPDYWVEYVDKDGAVRRKLIEVKPLAQTKQPTRKHKHLLYEKITYAVNVAKWQAAVAWCKLKSAQDGIPIQFEIITEKSIFK